MLIGQRKRRYAIFKALWSSPTYFPALQSLSQVLAPSGAYLLLSALCPSHVDTNTRQFFANRQPSGWFTVEKRPGGNDEDERDCGAYEARP